MSKKAIKDTNIYNQLKEITLKDYNEIIYELNYYQPKTIPKIAKKLNTTQNNIKNNLKMLANNNIDSKMFEALNNEPNIPNISNDIKKAYQEMQSKINKE